MPPTPTEQYLYPPHEYAGTLISEITSVPISFTLSADLTGQLQFDVDPIPTTKEASQFYFGNLGTVGRRIKEFSISASCSEGWQLESNRVSIGGPTKKSSHKGNIIELGLRAQKAVLRRPRTSQDKQEALVFLLKGFECYGFPSVPHELGEVRVGGSMSLENADQINGQLSIRRSFESSRPSDWRAKSESLLQHVNHVLGFARGAPLRVPVVEHYGEDFREVIFYSTTSGHKSFLAPCNSLDIGAIFQTAVASLDEIGDRKDALDLAMGWFMLPTNYDSVRYLSCMTALESLVARDTSDLNTSVVDTKKFRVLRKKLETVIDEHTELESDARISLKEKLGGLNRVALRTKLELLAARWSVPLDDFPPGFLRSLLDIRDEIIHRGEWDRENDLEIWDHLVPLRELVARFIFAGLSYRGSYLCYLNGHEVRQFPPKAT